MLRRLTLGVLASSLLALATVAVAGAQAMPSPPQGPTPPSAEEQGPMHPGARAAVAPSRTEHPGDQVYGAPCAGCYVIVDPCEFLDSCQQLPGGLPFPPALHWTTLRPNVPQFFPRGPFVCAPAQGSNVPRCVDALTAGIRLPAGAPPMMPGGSPSAPPDTPPASSPAGESAR